MVYSMQDLPRLYYNASLEVAVLVEGVRLTVCPGAFALHPDMQLSHTHPFSPMSPKLTKPLDL